MINKLINNYKAFPIQVKATFWFLVCSILQRGISIITTPIFTRIMSTAEYGQYNVFNSWLGVVTVFLTLNLSAGVYSQGLIKYNRERNLFASALQGLMTTLVLAGTVVYLLFSDFWNTLLGLTTSQMISMLVMIWSTSIFNFWSMGQRIDFKYRKLVFVTVIMSIIQPSLGMFLVLHMQDKVTARIIGIVLVQVVIGLILFVIQFSKNHTFYHKRFWQYAVHFNLPLIPHYLSQVVLNNSDRIMIDKMVGSDEAGIYSLAYSISIIMSIINQAVLQTMEPWLYRKINEKEIEDISRVAYPCFLFVAGANLMLMIFAPEVIAIFAPPQYYDAIWIIPPVAMSVFFTFSYTFFAVFEFYFEKTQYIAVATMVGAVVNVVLNAAFINLFGYLAAGYTTLICYILYALFHFIFMRKICKEKLNNRQPYSAKIYWSIAGGFIILGIGCLLTYNNSYIRYAVISIMVLFSIVKRKRILFEMKKLASIKYRQK